MLGPMARHHCVLLRPAVQRKPASLLPGVSHHGSISTQTAAATHGRAVTCTQVLLQPCSDTA
jgi:hypothetical protein